MKKRREIIYFWRKNIVRDLKNAPFPPPTGISLTAGTFINLRMVSYLNTNRTRGSAIDRLTLQEQLINLLCGPLILMQLLRILVPLPHSDIFKENYLTCCFPHLKLQYRNSYRNDMPSVF